MSLDNELQKTVGLNDLDILGALRVVNDGGLGICIIADGNGRVEGVVTDGDIRRALIAGSPLDAPVTGILRRNFRHVSRSASRGEVLDLMLSTHIYAIPVLDDGVIVGLHVRDRLLGPPPRPNRALLLAGGRGSRLGELTNSTPKPLLRIAGRPVLERLLHQVTAAGISDITISVGYLGSEIVDHFGNGSRFGCRIEYVWDKQDEPLGTAGPLSLLEEQTADVLVANGDIVSNCDFGNLIDSHERSKADISIGTHELLFQVPFGEVLDDCHRVVRIDEKPRKTFQVNAGIYVVAPKVIALLPKGDAALMTDLIATAIESQFNVISQPLGADWIDVGSPQDLDRAQRLL